MVDKNWSLLRGFAMITRPILSYEFYSFSENSQAEVILTVYQFYQRENADCTEIQKCSGSSRT
jgi:hypothetical protein